MRFESRDTHLIEMSISGWIENILLLLDWRLPIHSGYRIYTAVCVGILLGDCPAE